MLDVVCLIFFFFQAEDGIRDYKVTGVQTCALPICLPGAAGIAGRDGAPGPAGATGAPGVQGPPGEPGLQGSVVHQGERLLHIAIHYE